MPQMKPIFWLDVLSSNSLCLYSIMSVLYFFLLNPLTARPCLKMTILDPGTGTIMPYNMISWAWKW